MSEYYYEKDLQYGSHAKRADMIPFTGVAFGNRDGKTIVKWTTNPDGSGSSYPRDFDITMTSNVTLYAQWDYFTFNWVFKANNGTTQSKTYTYNSTSKCIIPNPSDIGFTTPANKSFDYWIIEGKPEGHHYTSAEYFTNQNSGFTFVAVWKDNPWNISGEGIAYATTVDAAPGLSQVYIGSNFYYTCPSKSYLKLNTCPDGVVPDGTSCLIQNPFCNSWNYTGSTAKMMSTMKTETITMSASGLDSYGGIGGFIVNAYNFSSGTYATRIRLNPNIFTTASHKSSCYTNNKLIGTSHYIYKRCTASGCKNNLFALKSPKIKVIVYYSDGSTIIRELNNDNKYTASISQTGWAKVNTKSLSMCDIWIDAPSKARNVYTTKIEFYRWESSKWLLGLPVCGLTVYKAT